MYASSSVTIFWVFPSRFAPQRGSRCQAPTLCQFSVLSEPTSLAPPSPFSVAINCGQRGCGLCRAVALSPPIATRRFKQR